MHRALQTLARGNPRPDAVSLAAALRQEGLTRPAAASLAAEIQAELAACQADPFLTSLLAPDIPWAASEWLLEDQPHPGAIRRGVIDLLAFDGHALVAPGLQDLPPRRRGRLGSLHHPRDREVPPPTPGLPGDGGPGPGD